jgi:hypothetical protein
MRSRLLAAAVLLTVASAGCSDFFENSETTPSIVTPQMLTGSWNSVAIETKRTDTCTRFAWMVTQVSGDTATGPFTATCRASVLVTGTASGTLDEKTLTWSATATATVQGKACPIALSGTGSFDGLQLRLPFDGTTCVGDVTGTEILRK